MKTLGFFFSTVAVVLLSSCNAPIAAPTQQEANTAIRPSLQVAALPITDVVPFYVASAQGYFTDAGVQVEVIPVSSGAERDTVVQAGEAECELTDIQGTVLTNAGNGRPIKIVSTARQASREQAVFYLLASPQSEISSPSALAGTTIAISENTIIDYWTERMLPFAGIALSDVATTNVPQIPVRLELLLSGQVDAAVLPDPLASFAEMQGAVPVLDDAENGDVAVSVIACSQDVIDSMPEAVQALVNGWDQAVASINGDPAAYQNTLIDNTRVPEPLQDNYTLPPYAVESLPSESQVADVVEWAKSSGLIEAVIPYSDIVDSSFRSE